MLGFNGTRESPNLDTAGDFEGGTLNKENEQTLNRTDLALLRERGLSGFVCVWDGTALPV